MKTACQRIQPLNFKTRSFALFILLLCVCMTCSVAGLQPASTSSVDLGARLGEPKITIFRRQLILFVFVCVIFLNEDRRRCPCIRLLARSTFGQDKSVSPEGFPRFSISRKIAYSGTDGKPRKSDRDRDNEQ